MLRNYNTHSSNSLSAVCNVELDKKYIVQTANWHLQGPVILEKRANSSQHRTWLTRHHSHVSVVLPRRSLYGYNEGKKIIAVWTLKYDDICICICMYISMMVYVYIKNKKTELKWKDSSSESWDSMLIEWKEGVFNVLAKSFPAQSKHKTRRLEWNSSQCAKKFSGMLPRRGKRT